MSSSQTCFSLAILYSVFATYLKTEDNSMGLKLEHASESIDGFVKQIAGPHTRSFLINRFKV